MIPNYTKFEFAFTKGMEGLYPGVEDNNVCSDMIPTWSLCLGFLFYFDREWRGWETIFCFFG